MAREVRKQYWILIFFIAPLAGMIYYFATFEYKVDPALASKVGISPNNWLPGPIIPGTTNNTITDHPSGMLTYSVTLNNPAVRILPSGLIQLNGHIIMTNNSLFPVTVIDAPLSVRKLWTARLSPTQGGLGNQLSDLPLIETSFKDVPASSRPEQEQSYITISPGREVRISFLCTLTESQIGPGKYLLEVHYTPRMYAQTKGLSTINSGVNLEGFYGPAKPFEVLPRTSDVEK